METKLEVVKPENLSAKEIGQLRSLSHRKEGQISTLLMKWRYDPRATVIRIVDEDNRVLSWALLTPYTVDKAPKRTDFQIYTRASERRKGYGKLLYKKAMQLVGGRAKLVVHPTRAAGDASSYFFADEHFSKLNDKDQAYIKERRANT